MTFYKSGGARYGLMLGLVWAICHFVAPQPAGDAAFWLLIALQALHGAVMTWRRMRLPLTALGDTLIAGFAAAIAALFLGGYTPQTLPLRDWLLLMVVAAIAAILLLVEPRLHPAAWEAWRNETEKASALDILLGRHVPRLQ
jgi:hypothetical protein